MNSDRMSTLKNASAAGSMLGNRSVKARKEKWGEEEFARRMREWGKLGGRPRKKPAQKATKGGK